MTLLNKESIT